MNTHLLKFVIVWICAALSITANAQDADSTLVGKDSGVVQRTLPLADTLPVKTSHERDHVYRMNYWVSGSFCVVATAADVYAIPAIIKSKPDLTPLELQGINKNAVPWFDRWALYLDPSKRQMYLNAANYTLPVFILTPGLLAFDKKISKDWFRILVMYYEMHAVTFSMYNFSFFGPGFENKYRPVTYYTQLPTAERIGGNNRNSMYSGHAATAVASTFFMVKVYSDYHPELNSQKKCLLYALATLPGFVMGYLRVSGLEHFPSDVMVGMTIGAVCGVLVPELHRFKNHKIVLGMSSSPTGGAGINMLWNMDQPKH